MPAPDIPAAKRAGLPVDLARLTAEGDAWLTPEDRYALKTHGVCTQLQDGVFMVRVRIPGGVASTAHVRALGRLARRFASDWIHLTTRQNVEFHWVDARDVEALLDGLAGAGLSTRSACGHTLRNVMCSEDSGVGLDEPFDCFPDAKRASDAIVARSAQLNVTMPSRINMAFGGSERCRDDALVNDAAFVSVLRDGEPGYEVWAGGSLGKAPALAIPLADFVARRDVPAAADALIDVFIEHGDVEKPAKGRMKFVIEQLGADAFRAAWRATYDRLRATADAVAPPPVEVVATDDHTAILTAAPAGGWSAGVRPQRTPGRALVTIGVPMGDTSSSELDLIADLADRYADGHLTISRDQDITLRNVDVAALPQIRVRLAERGLGPLGERANAGVRACTGSTVCALGITDSPRAAGSLGGSGALARNPQLRIHVSGCPNSCAQHQIADIGLAGSKVRVNGATVDGYQVFLGADLAQRQIGEVIGRIGAIDVPAAVEALVGMWESLRRPHESIGRTARRIGLDAVGAHVQTLLAERWASGPEPPATADPALATTPVAVSV